DEQRDDVAAAAATHVEGTHGESTHGEGEIPAHAAIDAPVDTAVPAVERIEIVPASEAPATAAAETESFDPWSARDAVEAASLAPFAGDFVEEAGPEETGQNQPEAQAGHAAARDGQGARDEAPQDGFPEPATVPLAETEEGVPFVSQTE